MLFKLFLAPFFMLLFDISLIVFFFLPFLAVEDYLDNLDEHRFDEEKQKKKLKRIRSKKTSKGSERRYRKKMAQNEVKPSTSVGTYKCEICQKKFNTLEIFVEHQFQHQ